MLASPPATLNLDERGYNNRAISQLQPVLQEAFRYHRGNPHNFFVCTSLSVLRNETGNKSATQEDLCLIPRSPSLLPAGLGWKGAWSPWVPRASCQTAAIYIEDGVIRAVQPASAPAPAGFEDAPRIRTGDTLFPGLIELHNHLAYNAIPIWLVPEHYTNNAQWRGTHEYRRNVTGPAKVLGNTIGLVEAVIRYVECRSLLGGTTTSQGITLIGVGTREFFAGLVRNVEAPLVPGPARRGDPHR